ncbi:putative metal-dependent phosphohydrolase [Bradyrhizobium oligotrophicum S58]|uniref:Putative metal-dependent phosphohydrolase n=1 Tax=Bradyrhizobium oligotrophicum S58 TaxID=1245469 RepID=M5A162_9BRAD|nr:HD domain-containing protein [Bradyrhizobium oligotrophicum]BAM92555.1 putative metal-dependent phosphohydrolase [Bradyrhizobium oligotrophicum S58]
MLTGLRLVSEAAELAARRHAGRQRKGRDEEPYINHLAEVANILSIASNGEDAELVAAGWLHDTIEDTDTTHAELTERFGARVADMVEEVTDDMTLPKSERRAVQVIAAPGKSDGAKQIKIADKISNIRTRVFFEPDLEQQLELMEYLGWAEQVVAGCRGVNAALDALFDETVAHARGTL